LKNLIGLAKESFDPVIFTLNYDLSLETIMEANSITYSTGFTKPKDIHTTYLPSSVELWPFGYMRELMLWNGTDIFRQTPDGEEPDVRLIKIHGSLDWFRIARPPIYDSGLRLFPEDPIVRCGFLPSETIEEIMIAGRSGKQRLEEPFLPLLRDFFYTASRANVLVIIGYSFSDAHINSILIDTQLMFSSYDIIVINGPNWPDNASGGEFMSTEAKKTWSILFKAREQSYKWEYLSQIQVLPYYAETAINEGYLQNTLKEVLEQKRTRRP
jgi:hypothetical protein